MNSLDDQLKHLSEQLTLAQSTVDRDALFADKGNILFEKNLKSFQHYFPDIYDKFLVHQPDPEKFQLFVNADGLGNIIDYDTKVPMYSDDIDSQIQHQISLALKNPELSRIDHSAVEHLVNETNFLHVDLMRKIGAIYNQTSQNLKINNSVDDVIPSMVIFGVGLGYHLQQLVDETKAVYITIFEPNEDYFFASLFCFDWSYFLETVDKQGGALYLGIGVPEDELYEVLFQRVQQLGAYSIAHSFFYQHYPSVKINNLIAEIRLNFHQFFMGWGFFDDALLSIAHTVQNSVKPVGVLNSKRNAMDKQLLDYPIFIVANGPSLDKDIEQLKELKDKAIIVSCNSASTALINYGIIPDFHVALERTKATYDFLSYMLNDEQRAKINLLVLNVMYPDVLDLFGWCGVALKGNEAGTSMFHLGEFISRQEVTPTIGYSNPLVGNTALSFFTALNFKEIYLFGVDNGYVDPNHHHSKASYYYNNQGATIHNPLKMGKEIRVPGNFSDWVITDHFMHTGKEQMERLLLSFKGTGLHCFNCSDGTFIEHTIPLRSSDIMLSSTRSKHDVIAEIKNVGFKNVDSELNLEQLLDFDVFESICRTMVEFLEQPMHNRADGLNNLLASLRYLYSFKQGGRYIHLYLILEGEALYTSSVLLSILYNFGKDREIIPYYREALTLWIEFLRQAPNYYRERWNKLSDYSFDYSKPSVENA